MGTGTPTAGYFVNLADHRPDYMVVNVNEASATFANSTGSFLQVEAGCFRVMGTVATDLNALHFVSCTLRSEQ